MGRWALSICVACILVGALELLLPERESFKSIKTVLALYILLSVVSPASQTDWSGLLKAMQTTQVKPRDYSAYVESYSQTTLADSLENALSAAGITGEVTVAEDNGLCVYLRSDQPQQAEKVISQALGNGENIRIITEDSENET